jgi:enoyl-CoA hydratase/carnithine racemase
MSEPETVRVEHDERITIVTIDRPQVRNAVDRPTSEALARAFRDFDHDDDHDVAVFTGANGVFCAGADLKAIANGKGVPVREEGDGPMGPTRMLLAKPVIAAVEGFAVAGGLELALWCDMRVAANDAVFGVYCRRWGVPLIDGGTIRLPRLIGQSHAMDLILTGRGVSGDEALRIGLANRLTDPGDALAAAVSLAKALAALPQRCMRADRMSAYEQWDKTLPDALRIEYGHGLDVIAHGDMLEGVGKFVGGAGRHGRSAD